MGSNLKAAVSITVSSLLKKAVFRILLKVFYNGFILILCNIFFRYGQTCTKGQICTKEHICRKRHFCMWKLLHGWSLLYNNKKKIKEKKINKNYLEKKRKIKLKKIPNIG